MSRTPFCRDALFWAAIMGGPAFWCLLLLAGLELQSADRLSANLMALLLVMLVYPVLEEIVFRGGVQEWLAGRLGSVQRYGISLANVLTSVLFAALHFFHHPPLWAAAVFLPSLVFGLFKDRHNGLLAPIVLHVFYNSGYALLFMPFIAG